MALPKPCGKSDILWDSTQADKFLEPGRLDCRCDFMGYGINSDMNQVL